MSHAESTITQKGQITIPAELRRKLGLKPNDRVQFDLEEDGIKIRPAESRVLRSHAVVQPVNRPEDWQAVRAEVEEMMAADVVAEDRE